MKTIETGHSIGIVGGGQLGRMTALAAANLGYRVHVFSNYANSPASYVCAQTTVANFNDVEAMTSFAKQVDVVTFEFENIPHQSIQAMESIRPVRPAWQALHVTQNRNREKEFISSLGIKTAPYMKVESQADLEAGLQQLDSDCILKASELGYDGKGQRVIKQSEHIDGLWHECGFSEAVLEGFVPFVKEVSVIIARTVDGTKAVYPVAENVHQGGILKTSSVPATVSQAVSNQAADIAERIADALQLIGILAVELFVLDDDTVLVNELAARPHNSGHWTMDACVTSQFEQYVRAICGLPLGGVDIRCPAVMHNLIGDEVNQWQTLLQDPRNKLHLYGKDEAREGRKMGHVTQLMDQHG